MGFEPVKAWGTSRRVTPPEVGLLISSLATRKLLRVALPVACLVLGARNLMGRAERPDRIELAVLLVNLADRLNAAHRGKERLVGQRLSNRAATAQ